MEQVLFAVVIALAFVFAFINGFHDGSNIVATSVLSRAITPKKALAFAAIAEFGGAILFGTAVATTIGNGLLDPVFLHPSRPVDSGLVLLSALVGTIVWNVMTWWVGMPPSSSHSLIGGLLGGVIAASGFSLINWSRVLVLLVILLVSPVAGVVIGRSTMTLSSSLFRNRETFMNEFYRRTHLPSLLFLAASHGTNNAQKAMGLVTMMLVISGPLIAFEIPLWVFLGCAGTLSLGVYAGGWNIVKILGNRVFRIHPRHSSLSQLSSGCVMLAASLLGSPVSAIEVVKSTVIGARDQSLKRGVPRMVARDIAIAWMITMPATAFLAAAIYWTASGALGEGMGSFENLMRMFGQ